MIFKINQQHAAASFQHLLARFVVFCVCPYTEIYIYTKHCNVCFMCSFQCRCVIFLLLLLLFWIFHFIHVFVNYLKSRGVQEYRMCFCKIFCFKWVNEWMKDKKCLFFNEQIEWLQQKCTWRWTEVTFLWMNSLFNIWVEGQNNFFFKKKKLNKSNIVGAWVNA